MKSPNSLPLERWEHLIETLRHEAQEYGGFLNLIADEQACILERTPERLTGLVESIEAQAKVNKKLCEARERLVCKISDELQLTTVTLKGLIPSAPQKFQGLLEALAVEITSLVQRAQQKAQQNQTLLLRAYVLSETLLKTIHPQTKTTQTYTKKGTLAFCSPPSICVNAMR